jgi:serine protease Do
MKSFPRARFGAAVAVAFFCGLIFASGLDLTRFGWAQTRVTGGPSVSVPAPAVASLAESQNAFETIVDRVKPAVVSIHVAKFASEKPQPAPQRGRGQRQERQPQIPPGLEEFMKEFGGMPLPDPGQRPRQGSGSGFLVSKDGYILTNNHVIADMDRVTVSLVDHRSFDAKVVGRDPTTDVAVIKIEGSNFPFISLGDDATARVGQWVLAIGNPLELDFTVTAGIISAKGRTVPLPNAQQYGIQDFIQTDAAINPGNSGGPLVNIRGEVIGINSAIASGTGYYSGYGFAIPIGLARQVMKDLIEHGEVRRAIVGVALNDVTPEDAEAAGLREIRGAKVSDFTSDDSPAKRAGVKVGDIITAVDGKPIDQISTLQRIIRGYSIGQTVTLEVQRFGEKKQIPVRLTEVKKTAPAEILAERNDESGASNAERVSTKSFDKLGLTLSTLPPNLLRQANIPAEARNGLLVTDVAQRSAAATQRLFGPQDIIEEVLYPVQRDIKSISDLEDVVSDLKSRQVITLRVYQVGVGSRSVSLRIP